LYLLKLLSGPIAFAITMSVPLDLSYEGRVVLATFICAIVWWITEPIPWAMAAMLPFLVFPAAGVMDIVATMRLYGQPIFFWIMGTVLMGYAIEKHGLANRFALAFLAMKGVGGRTNRLMFVYMLIVGTISMFISDAATIAMTIPIGMSIVRHAGTITAQSTERSRFAAFVTLGTFYASVAGGAATIMGVPHNAVALGMLEKFTGRQLGFFEWMSAGVPVFLALLIAFYAVLWTLLRPEILSIPAGETFLRGEQEKLGRIRPNERRVLAVFATMVTLFTLPTITALLFGIEHAWSVATARALPVWVVPFAAIFLLFTIRSSDNSADGLLTWKDAEHHAPWGSMFLVGGALAMTDALTEFGFVELMGGVIGGLGLGATTLPYVAAAVVGLSTNFMSATPLYCSIFIPAAAQIGFNPASMAILIGNMAVGLIFPWAGATSATAFAAGDVRMDQMIRIGLIVSVLFIVITATIHLLLAGVV
jgi:solute carrier family 13 (sodium-dependent dicarboxylate transporter), member 2/3/5